MHENIVDGLTIDVSEIHIDERMTLSGLAGGIPCHQWDIYIDGLCIQSKKSKS